MTPPILVPPTATSVTVSQTGLVTATIPGQTAPQTLGQLTIANFINEAGLQALGSNLFQQTAASGQPTVGVPGDTAFGVIQQGYLEVLERRSGVRDHQSDRGAARLRDEFQGHPGGRPDVGHHLQHAKLRRPHHARECDRRSAGVAGAVAGARTPARLRRTPPRRRRKRVIYPGDIIRDDMLTDLPANAPTGVGSDRRDRGRRWSARCRDARCCPARRSRSPRSTTRASSPTAAQVQLVYIEGGLTIVDDSARRCRTATVGDIIKVRNDDSGVTVIGVVQPDGAVRVSG